MSFDHPKMRLLVHLPNWVGDVIMTTPTLVQLRTLGFHLTLLGRPWASDLLSGYGFDIRPISRNVRQTARILKGTGCGQGLLFPNSFSSAMSMRLAGIHAVGYRTDGRRLLLHRSIFKPANKHEVEYFWDLGKFASTCWAANPSLWAKSPPKQLVFPVTSEARLAAARALAQHHIDQPFIVVCPGGVVDAQHQARIWPRFYDFCRALVGKGYKVVTCPAPSEVFEYRRLLPEVTTIAGLSLNELAAVLQNADKVVSSDTGPMHLATAVATPCLGIFGPTTPGRTRPWNGHYVGGLSGQWPSWEDVGTAFEALTNDGAVKSRNCSVGSAKTSFQLAIDESKELPADGSRTKSA